MPSLLRLYKSFVGSDGAPLATQYVYVTESGGNIPVQLFANAAGTLPLPKGQPLVTDANGLVSAYVRFGLYRLSVSVSKLLPPHQVQDGVAPAAGLPDLIASATWNPASLVDGAQQTMSPDITLAGAILGDLVEVSFSQPLLGTSMWAEVQAADTIRVYHSNESGSTADLASGTVTVKVTRRRT